MKNATHMIVGGIPSNEDALSCSRQFLLSWSDKTYLEQVKKQILEITPESPVSK